MPHNRPSIAIGAVFAIVFAAIAPAAPDEEAPPPNPEQTLTNNLGMQFRLIPSGSFTMGSERGNADEKPVHEVILSKPFYLGIHEVTQAQWQAVMGSNPAHFKDPNRPVENVSWNDAQEFCKRLSEKDSARYRLPTEAEWEYACRAGTKTEFYWGARFSGDFAWARDNSEGAAHTVGGKKSNPWGLYDMGGNVYEWCQDNYGRYPSSDQVDPLNSDGSRYHVDRGGCWYNDGEYCRSADRGGRLDDFRDFFVGLRVVREK